MYKEKKNSKSFMYSQVQYDSGIASLKRICTDGHNSEASNPSAVGGGKENTIPSGGHKRARKALLHSWTSTPNTPDSLATVISHNMNNYGNDQKVSSLFLVETPVSIF